MSLVQILAIAIFVIMFAAIIWGKVHRYIPALIGAGVVLAILFPLVMRETEPVLNVLNIGQLFEKAFWLPGEEHIESRGINWQTIVFIAGMMVMVEGLAKVGFFRWMCLLVAKIVHYKVVPILITFMVLAGLLSMFIDSITVMLFLSTVTIEIARMLKFDPIPVVIAEIFASNTGGSATMSGDPPNIIIGTSLGYTFTDFLENTGPIAWVGMIAALVFFYLIFRKTLSSSQQNRAESPGTTYPEPRGAIENMPLFLVHTGIFILIIVLLVTHAQTGISVALIGVIAAVLTLLAAINAMGHLLKRTDWRTLIFFMGLFVVVGGLEETGVLGLLAERIGVISGGDLAIVMTIILWLSGIASAVVDNIPFAATMVPVISGLSRSLGLNLQPIAWSLALGTDIGGNATPIGASANVVGTAICEREGYPVGWGRYLKYSLPATIIVMAICTALLVIRY